jgi:nucleotide-binding universal stress UspA family protein
MFQLGVTICDSIAIDLTCLLNFTYVLNFLSFSNILQPKTNNYFFHIFAALKIPTLMNTNADLIETTLVPIDFSETSLMALEQAVALTSVLNENSKITLLHIIEGASFPTITESAHEAATDHHDVLAIEGAINRLHKIAESHGREGIEFSFVIAGGKAYKKIAEIASDIKADTIVMGTHGSSGIQAFAGSNASKVIQIAPCPVIVIKQKPVNQGCKNIVLPLDLTLETRQKVNFAVKIAKHYGSTVHIVSMEEKDEFLSTRLENNLAQVEAYLNERGIPTTTNTMKASGGNFVKQTLAWAEGKGADLIIIMSQQDKELSEYIYGSYSQQIVNRSNIPVMAVNPNPSLEGILENTTGSGIYSH